MVLYTPRSATHPVPSRSRPVPGGLHLSSHPLRDVGHARHLGGRWVGARVSGGAEIGEGAAVIGWKEVSLQQ